MIRLSSNASVKDTEFAVLNLMVQVAEKQLGADIVKKELARHKVLFLEVPDEDDPHDS